MIIIDVRTKGEYEGGHIEGALHHDIMDMMSGVFPELSKEQKIILYCESGNRSMMAKKLMNNSGFFNVCDGGGMDEFDASLFAD